MARTKGALGMKNRNDGLVTFKGSCGCSIRALPCFTVHCTIHGKAMIKSIVTAK